MEVEKCFGQVWGHKKISWTKIKGWASHMRTPALGPAWWGTLKLAMEWPAVSVALHTGQPCALEGVVHNLHLRIVVLGARHFAPVVFSFFFNNWGQNHPLTLCNSPTHFQSSKVILVYQKFIPKHTNPLSPKAHDYKKWVSQLPSSMA